MRELPEKRPKKHREHRETREHHRKPQNPFKMARISIFKPRFQLVDTIISRKSEKNKE